MEDATALDSALESFSLSEVEDSMEQNISHTNTLKESLLREKGVAADQVDCYGS